MSDATKPKETSVGDMYAALERIFHEPNRLAIVSALIPNPEGMRFREIKEACELTDGNLSRHLKTLESKGIVEIEKTFKDAKPMTTVSMTREGRQKFMAYLEALESVLKRATKAIKASERASKASPKRKPRKA